MFVSYFTMFFVLDDILKIKIFMNNYSYLFNYLI